MRPLRRWDPICGVFTAEPAAKPQVRLIVQMYGGAIERVYQDCPGVQVIDIIFTEDGKYLEGPCDRDRKGRLLYPVSSRPEGPRRLLPLRRGGGRWGQDVRGRHEGGPGPQGRQEGRSNSTMNGPC